MQLSLLSSRPHHFFLQVFACRFWTVKSFEPISLSLFFSLLLNFFAKQWSDNGPRAEGADANFTSINAVWGENPIIDCCEAKAAPLPPFTMQSWLVVIDLAINLHHCCIYTTFVCFSDILTLILGGKKNQIHLKWEACRMRMQSDLSSSNHPD